MSTRLWAIMDKDIPPPLKDLDDMGSSFSNRQMRQHCSRGVVGGRSAISHCLHLIIRTELIIYMDITAKYYFNIIKLYLVYIYLFAFLRSFRTDEITYFLSGNNKVISLLL